MLKRVQINNFGLVKEVNLEFKSGFTAITGETGAGKSFFTKALQLGFGGRSKEKNSLKSIIEIEFGDTIFRRILEEKRSRFFIDDIPEKTQTGQDFILKHLDFHGQNDHLFLKKPESAEVLLDNSLDNLDIKKNFIKAFLEYSELKKEIKSLQKEFSEFQNQQEFWEFQLEKMNPIKFSINDLGLAEALVQTGEEDLKIKPLILESIELLAGEEHSLLSGLDRAEILLADIDPKMAEKIRPYFSEISQIVQELEKKIPEENFELESAQDLISKINKWQKKFNVASPQALLEKKFSLQENLKHLKDLEEKIIKAEEVSKDKYKIALELAENLSTERKKIQKTFGEKVQKKCRTLGMLPAKFEVKFTSQELSIHGTEIVEFYFSANKAQSLKPLSQTASGGEIARITLALKHFWPVESTMIFDEIDTGVSGAIAEKMADEMQELSQNKQILAITHLPQIAAKADHHFVVEKKHLENTTQTTIREVFGDERIEILASMLSGSEITEEAREAAKKLLEK